MLEQTGGRGTDGRWMHFLFLAMGTCRGLFSENEGQRLAARRPFHLLRQRAQWEEWGETERV